MCVEVEVVDAPLDYNLFVRKDLDLCHAICGCYSFLGLVVSTRGLDSDHQSIVFL
jgi:hypothetical protein